MESEKDEISPSVLKAHGFGNEGEKQTKTLLRFNISQDEKVRNNPKVPVFRKISQNKSNLSSFKNYDVDQ